MGVVQYAFQVGLNTCTIHVERRFFLSIVPFAFQVDSNVRLSAWAFNRDPIWLVERANSKELRSKCIPNAVRTRKFFLFVVLTVMFMVRTTGSF